MKGVTSTILFILMIVKSVAQGGQISGTIIDHNNQPIAGANVMVKNTSKGIQSDINGEFELTLSSFDNVKLVISSIGYKTKTISVSNAEKIKVTLYEGNELLNEVVVDTNRKNKFSRKKSAYVAKLPLKNIENSQVYSTVTNQLLISQSVVRFEEALENTTGVEKLWSSTGRGGDGAGYYSIRGFAVQPQLVNGVPGITNGFINPDNVERIEVIKGPSATLFGSTVTSYGGLINIVTKKPYKGTGGKITVGAGSFGFNKVTVDFNTNLESNENISLRFNAGYQTEDSFQDAGFRKSLFLAPALSYKVNNRLTLNFNYELSSTDQTNQPFLFFNRHGKIPFNTVEELNYDYKKSLTNNDISIKNPTQNYRGEIAYKISDRWSSQTIFAGGNTKSNGIYTYLWNLFDPNPNNQNVLPAFSLNAQKSNAETNTFNIQQNFSGDFKIGAVRNRIVIGLDYLEHQELDQSSNWALINVNSAQGNVLSGLPLSSNNVNNLLNGVGNINTNINQNILSGYVSDVVHILPELSVMAGIRYDIFNYKGDANDPTDDEKAYTKQTFSPKFGIVYQPIFNKLSVFANYQNGFTYVNPEIVPINISDPSLGTRLQSFDLEQANQLEFGAKTNLFNNKLETTLSYYNIIVNNKVMGFGVGKVQDGKIKSQGFELELNANPVDGLNLRGGFSYNDNELLESKTSSSSIGKRIAEAGPAMSYNFWSDYKFKDGIAKNFGLGFGFNGASAYDTMVDYVVSGGFTLPAYTILNASIYYEVEKFRISIKANNLTDQEFYTGWNTLTPQNPRFLLGTLCYKF